MYLRIKDTFSALFTYTIFRDDKSNYSAFLANSQFRNVSRICPNRSLRSRQLLRDLRDVFIK